MKGVNISRYFLFLGSVSSTALLLAALCYITGALGGGGLKTENVINSIVLISQKVLMFSVFAAAATDMLFCKKDLTGINPR